MGDAPALHSPAKAWPVWKCASLLPLFLIAAVALYINADHESFFYDSGYGLIKTDDIPARFQRGMDQLVGNLFLPSQGLSIISFMLNARFNEWIGAEPFDITSFLIFNALVHGFNAWLVFLLIRRLLRIVQADLPQADWFALGLSLVFLAHPLHASSVAYIMQRRGALATLFYVLAILCYLEARFARRSNRMRIGFALCIAISFWLSIKSKEFTLTLPVALLVIELCFRATNPGALLRSLKWLVPGVAIAAGLLLIYAFSIGLFDPTELTIRPFGGSEAVQWTFYQHLLTQLVVFVHYWKLLWLPLPQWMAIDHMGWIVEGMFHRGAYLAILFHVLILGAAVLLALKRYTLAAIGILWFYIALIPYAFLPQRAIMVEYKTYLPSIGLMMILAELLRLVVRKTNRRLPFAALVLIALVFAGMTLHRNRIYQDEERLWLDTIAKHPQNYLAHERLGVVYLQRAQFNEAIPPLERSLELRSGSASAQRHLAIALAQVSREDEAIRHYYRALQINPALADAWYELGELLSKRNDVPAAIKAFREAVELRPEDFASLWGLATAYVQAGQWDEAAQVLRRAIAYRPDAFEPHYALANVEVRRNRPTEAIVAYQTALSINPDHGETHKRLGLLFARTGKQDLAIRHIESAIENGQRTTSNLKNLAVLLRQAGRANEAITRLQQATELDPSDQDAHYKLGLLLTEQNRPTEAINVFEHLLTLNPNHQGALRALRRLHASD